MDTMVRVHRRVIPGLSEIESFLNGLFPVHFLDYFVIFLNFVFQSLDFAIWFWKKMVMSLFQPKLTFTQSGTKFSLFCAYRPIGPYAQKS